MNAAEPLREGPMRAPPKRLHKPEERPREPRREHSIRERMEHHWTIAQVVRDTAEIVRAVKEEGFVKEEERAAAQDAAVQAHQSEQFPAALAALILALLFILMIGAYVFK